jgi:hypothetical protein
MLSFFPGTGNFPYGTPAIPADATAVVLNVTPATSTADSYLTVWAPGDRSLWHRISTS